MVRVVNLTQCPRGGACGLFAGGFRTIVVTHHCASQFRPMIATVFFLLCALCDYALENVHCRLWCPDHNWAAVSASVPGVGRGRGGVHRPPPACPRRQQRRQACFPGQDRCQTRALGGRVLGCAPPVARHEYGGHTFRWPKKVGGIVSGMAVS